MKDLRTLYLKEIDLQTIQQNNVVGFPNTKSRQNLVATVNPQDIKFIPYQDSLKLKVTSRVMSKGKSYDASIVFDDVGFEPVINNEPGTIEITGTDNTDYNIHPVMVRGDDVEISCTCPDFKFRFAPVHYQNKSLDGNPPPTYVKKPGSTRPPVNPDNILGSCKHISALANKLKQMRIML